MKLKTAQAITAKWNELDDGEISTEMLFSLTGEVFGIDHGQVAKALRIAQENEEKERKP